MNPESISAMQRIEEAVRNVPGWSPVDQLYELYKLVYESAYLPGDVLEVGSWCGRSSLALGFAVQNSGGGKVHCIDLFPEKEDWYSNSDGSYSFEVRIGERVLRSYDEQTVWEAPFVKDIKPIYQDNPSLYNRFCNTILNHSLGSIVQPFHGDLSMFLSQAGEAFKCRLAFIDAHHGYEAVSRDIEALTPYLVEGGWICFDDAFTTYEGVDRAITEKIIENCQFDQFAQPTRKLFIARKKVAL